MHLTINGEAHRFKSRQSSLPALLEELGFAEIPVLVELNGEAVLRKEMDQVKLSEGDRLEIVQMVAGG